MTGGTPIHGNLHIPRLRSKCSHSEWAQQPGLDGPVLTSTSCHRLIRSRWQQQNLPLNPSVDDHSLSTFHVFGLSFWVFWCFFGPFPMAFWSCQLQIHINRQGWKRHCSGSRAPPSFGHILSRGLENLHDAMSDGMFSYNVSKAIVINHPQRYHL